MAEAGQLAIAAVPDGPDDVLSYMMVGAARIPSSIVGVAERLRAVSAFRLMLRLFTLVQYRRGSKTYG